MVGSGWYCSIYTLSPSPKPSRIQGGGASFGGLPSRAQDDCGSASIASYQGRGEHASPLRSQPSWDIRTDGRSYQWRLLALPSASPGSLAEGGLNPHSRVFNPLAGKQLLDGEDLKPGIPGVGEVIGDVEIGGRRFI